MKATFEIDRVELLCILQHAASSRRSLDDVLGYRLAESTQMALIKQLIAAVDAGKDICITDPVLET